MRPRWHSPQLGRRAVRATWRRDPTKDRSVLRELVDWIDQAVSKIERGFVCLLMPVVVVVTFLQVIFRYVLNQPLVWSEELAIYLFIWIAFLGASMGVATGGHYGIELLKNKLPTPLRLLCEGIIYLVSFYFLLTVAILGARMVIETHHVSTSMQISMRWFYSAIPTGGFLMCVHLLAQLCRERPATPPPAKGRTK